GQMEASLKDYIESKLSPIDKWMIATFAANADLSFYAYEFDAAMQGQYSSNGALLVPTHSMDPAYGAGQQAMIVADQSGVWSLAQNQMGADYDMQQRQMNELAAQDAMNAQKGMLVERMRERREVAKVHREVMRFGTEQSLAYDRQAHSELAATVVDVADDAARNAYLRAQHEREMASSMELHERMAAQAVGAKQSYDAAAAEAATRTDKAVGALASAMAQATRQTPSTSSNTYQLVNAVASADAASNYPQLVGPAPTQGLAGSPYPQIGAAPYQHSPSNPMLSPMVTAPRIPGGTMPPTGVYGQQFSGPGRSPALMAPPTTGMSGGFAAPGSVGGGPRRPGVKR
ncbi:MAG: hypothetical protein AB7F64_05170, partial [Gammaproteobacteria bacterium]